MSVSKPAADNCQPALCVKKQHDSPAETSIVAVNSTDIATTRPPTCVSDIFNILALLIAVKRPFSLELLVVVRRNRDVFWLRECSTEESVKCQNFKHVACM